jgi:hypothetical protein
MTNDLILEQPINDRRAALARSWPGRARTSRRGRGFKLRRGTGPTPGRAQANPHLGPAVPRVLVPANVDASGDWATSLAHRVAEHGSSGNEASIAQVVCIARRHHELRIAAEALNDRSLPDVVRERALGRLLTSLANTTDLNRDRDRATIDRAA